MFSGTTQLVSAGHTVMGDEADAYSGSLAAGTYLKQCTLHTKQVSLQ